MSHALVVDDSRTSSAMLGKMLKKHNIETVNVDSAEQALAYLKTARPAMIFMDHMMPGMDGFDAVKAIKAEPELAAIPIIMHTSKTGDIYVGHAHALGAADILSKPASDKALSDVLARLAQPVDLVELSELISADFDEAPRHPTLEQAALSQPMLEAIQYEANSYGVDNRPKWLSAVAALMVVGLLLVLMLYFKVSAEQQALQRQQQDLYELSSWAASQAASYDYGEQPLAGSRQRLIEGMLSRLIAMGFAGELQIEGHIGAFCLSETLIAGGEQIMLLAPADLPLAACSQLGLSAGQAQLASVEQSEAFSRFMNSSPLLNGSGVRLVITGKGSSEPLYDYPSDSESSNAGDWNMVAMQNNRLLFNLVPN
ncbi:response regulator [Dasania marina]|uniref:response regulator n=1 Tax=Dasania marina TaxID=471499 RepID=UPI00038298EF|nr:response regulator [Dasania marina]